MMETLFPNLKVGIEELIKLRSTVHDASHAMNWLAVAGASIALAIVFLAWRSRR